MQITQLLGYSVSGWGDLSTSPPEMVGQADEEASMILNGDKYSYVTAAQGMTRMTELQENLQVDDDARISKSDGGCWVQGWIWVSEEII